MPFSPPVKKLAFDYQARSVTSKNSDLETLTIQSLVNTGKKSSIGAIIVAARSAF
jgi:hypothetical protein